MKIEEIRTSFTIYVVGNQSPRLTMIAEHLEEAGYMVARFGELTAAFSEFFSNPPHFLIFDAGEAHFDLRKAIEQVRAQLPESHIFLTTPAADRTNAVKLLDAGVYELILTPLLSSLEVVKAFDRAAERNYFMYLNERLMQEREVAPTPVEPAENTDPEIANSVERSSTEDRLVLYTRELSAQTPS